MPKSLRLLLFGVLYLLFVTSLAASMGVVLEYAILDEVTFGVARFLAFGAVGFHVLFVVIFGAAILFTKLWEWANR